MKGENQHADKTISVYLIIIPQKTLLEQVYL